MKNIILSIVGFLSFSLVFAQEKTDSISVIPQLDSEVKATELVSQPNLESIIAPVIIVGLLIFLIITITKFILEFRLKNKIVNKGISEQLASSILAKDSENKNDEAVKSAILLCGIGIGVTITYYTMPFHLHSLAIMAFSIGVSYLAYFFYLKNQKK